MHETQVIPAPNLSTVAAAIDALPPNESFSLRARWQRNVECAEEMWLEPVTKELRSDPTESINHVALDSRSFARNVLVMTRPDRSGKTGVLILNGRTHIDPDDGSKFFDVWIFGDMGTVDAEHRWQFD